MSSVFAWLIMVVIFTTQITRQVSSAPCALPGWFGDDCKYLCHCMDNAVCDSATGFCPGKCDPDWFGPACQYASAKFSTPNGTELDLAWLSDNDPETCNKGDIHTITVTLDSPQPLTWLRLVVDNADILDHFKDNHHQYIGIVGCPDLRGARVDNVTLDVACDTSDVVSHVTLTGSRLETLCSLYISGGRNVALKQDAKQPSTLGDWTATRALDGDIGMTHPTQTCAHTNERGGAPSWWALSFYRPMNIMKVMVFSRRDCCQERLVEFRLDAFILPSHTGSESVFTYTDSTPSSSPKYEYTITPSPRIKESIQKIFITKSKNAPVLTLCEVMVFGDSDCQRQRFGRECEHRCNCAGGGNCFVSTGGCPSGCAPGYMGEDCSIACSRGKYGSGCIKACSAHCDGSSNDCDPSDGTCLSGCEPGYLPPQCDRVCNMTTYGVRCEKMCSSRCIHSDCHHLTGKCKSCPAGFSGDFCDKDKAAAPVKETGASSQRSMGISNSTVLVIVVVFVAACAAATIVSVCVVVRRSGPKRKESPPYDVAMSSTCSEMPLQRSNRNTLPQRDGYLMPSAFEAPENPYEDP